MREAQIEWTDGALESTVSIGPWFASTGGGSWAVFLDGVGPVRRGMRSSRAESKAAIVEALRELRVLLPVEAETAAKAVERERVVIVNALRMAAGDEQEERAWEAARALNNFASELEAQNGGAK